MKKLIYILTLFLIFMNIAYAAPSPYISKEFKVVTSDGYSINAQLEYPKTKKQKEYSTVVLLHSLGYSSSWWETLPEELLKEGYAVLKIDLRGHGKSIYNSKLVKNSWKNMTNSAYLKYPNDVIKVIEQVQSDNNTKIFFRNWAIVGADIGASTGVIVADKLDYKPKTIVMLSPIVKGKGLYIPIHLAQLSNVDILSICGTDDNLSINSQNYLKKFAQAEFTTYTSSSHSTGMLLLKNDSTLSIVIVKWLKEYLNIS